LSRKKSTSIYKRERKRKKKRGEGDKGEGISVRVCLKKEFKLYDN